MSGWVIECHTTIANMTTISPKRGFSVETVVKGWPALFFQEFCRLYIEKSKGRPVQEQIAPKYCKIHRHFSKDVYFLALET